MSTIDTLARRAASRAYLDKSRGCKATDPLPAKRYAEAVLDRDCTDEEVDAYVHAYRQAWDRKCPDDGTCHHACAPSECFRVAACSPLTVAGWGDEWPAEIKAAFGGAR